MNCERCKVLEEVLARAVDASNRYDDYDWLPDAKAALATPAESKGDCPYCGGLGEVRPDLDTFLCVPCPNCQPQPVPSGIVTGLNGIPIDPAEVERIQGRICEALKPVPSGCTCRRGWDYLRSKPETTPNEDCPQHGVAMTKPVPSGVRCDHAPTMLRPTATSCYWGCSKCGIQMEVKK